MSAINQLTPQEEYVAEAGNKCPVCGSTNINSVGPVERDEGYMVNDVECHDCGSLWTEKYDLVSYSMVETAFMVAT